MIISNEKLPTARYSQGVVHVTFDSGVAFSFPIKGNARLEKGTPGELGNIRVSSSGLHWPDVDEDLSFEGLMRGDYGQRIKA